MIIWLIGPSGAGKTTLANKLLRKGVVHLDGDEIRKVWPVLGYSKKDREINNLMIARLAKMLGDQGFNVIISVITPYEDIREQITEICDPIFIRVDHAGSQRRKDDAEFEDLDGIQFNIKI